jgi:uncharacterized membrane protein YozB (DUF420 family)
MVSLFAAQIDLALQGTILVLLIASVALMRLSKIKAHASLMLTAIVLNLVGFLTIMAPAFGSISGGFGGTISALTLLHATIGSLTLLLSFYVLGTWLIPSVLLTNPKMRCYGKFNKRLMAAITIMWIVTAAAGFFIYTLVYTTYLVGFTS